MSSGRTSAALDLTPPMPLKVRSWRSASRPAALSMKESSLMSAMSILLPMSALPTVMRAPGMSARVLRMRFSICMTDSLRSLRGVVTTVSTAVLISASAPEPLGPLALLPPPIDESTRTMFLSATTSLRTVSAKCCVCASVLPGGSCNVTCVWSWSPAGAKPLGNKGASEMDAANITNAASSVMKRWCKHHCMMRM